MLDRTRTCRLLIAGAGALALMRPHVASAACVPGFDFAVFTNGRMSIENYAHTDSYDSSVAPYAPGGCGGNLGTNGGSAGVVDLQNNVTVCGTIATTSGGTVTTSVSATYSSPSLTTTSPTALPPVSVPSLPSGWGGTYTSGVHALAPGFTYSALSCSGPHTVISLSAGTYVTGDVSLSNGCTIQVSSGPVLVYFTGVMDVAHASINTPGNTGLPTDLTFMGSGTQVIHIYNTSTVYAGIYAPRASEFHIEQRSELYGAVVAASFHAENHSAIHYDQAMATQGIGGFSCPPGAVGEVSRAQPVVATIAGTASLVQGTFELPRAARKTIATTADIAGFAFPYVKGHMRARVASSITAAKSSYDSGTILFDAGGSGKIPARVYSGCSTFSGRCRHVFTNTNAVPADGRTWHPARVDLNDGNASAIGALIAPASEVPGIGAAGWRTIVRKVLDGDLGGVDRSTVAVIEPSTYAGVATRPTIAYFGGTDGMLHAVCASTGGTTASASNICPSLGTELWAFLPGVQLPLIRSNTQRIDGSVAVVDAFGDIANDPATGTKSWHTILTFQTGYSIGGRAAVYAIDVTDPANPIILWENATPTAPAAVDLGPGLVMAAGPTRINGGLVNLAVAQTANGGSGGAGVFAAGFELETGRTQWRFTHAYPATPRGGTANLPYPTTGIVGGAVAVDLGGAGSITDVVFGDLYGNIWRVNATTGVSATGAGVPLFSFTTDKHPLGTAPAIFSSGGQQYAAFSSGGYVDPTATSWSAATQYLIAVRLKPTGAALPLNETLTACSTCNLLLNRRLTAQRGYSQALVVGSQLFVTLDSDDVNSSRYGTGTTSTGTLITVDLDGNPPPMTTTVIFSGASSIANIGTTLYNASSSGEAQLSQTATTTVGDSVDRTSSPLAGRVLWMRTQ